MRSPRSWFGLFSLLLSLSLGSACADDEEPGPPVDYTDQERPTEYWRIDLVGNASTARIDEIGRVDIGEERPAPNLDGDYLVISYAGEDVLDAVPVTFAAELLTEGELMPAEVITLDESNATVWVPAYEGVSAIEIVHRDGTVVETIAAAELPSEAFREVSISAYPTIAVGEPDDYIPPNFSIESIVAPTPGMIEQLGMALSKATPRARDAISHVYFVKYPNRGCIEYQPVAGCEMPNGMGPAACREPGKLFGQINGSTYGSHIIFNVDVEEDRTKTATHEAAHAYDNLLSQAALRGIDHEWPQSARAKAVHSVEEHLGGANLRSYWKQLNDTALETGFSTIDYAKNNNCALSNDQAIGAGYASPYGATQVGDDIAEFTAWAQVDGVSHAVCQQFQGEGSGDNFPVQLAIPYVKLSLLNRLGFIEDSVFEACTWGIEPGTEIPGIHLGSAYDFTLGVNTTAYEWEDKNYFGVLANNGQQEALVEAPIFQIQGNQFTSPIGLHQLRTTGSGWFDMLNELMDEKGTAGVYVQDLGGDGGHRASSFGLLLFSEVTPTSAEGAVFFLRLQNALGQDTDVIPYASFKVQ